MNEKQINWCACECHNATAKRNESVGEAGYALDFDYVQAVELAEIVIGE